MEEFVRKSGIFIPKQFKNKSFYSNIKNDLTRRMQKYNTSDFIVNTFYVETDKFLLIPRKYPVSKFVKSKIIDMNNDGEVIEITHNIEPRNDLQKRAINFLLENNNGIVELSPGVGKTVISIYMIGERKRKTLILVHTDALADQWKDRLLQFTNLKDENITRLTSIKFEENLKSPIIISTAQTFLSLLKRKKINFLKELNNSNIGVFIGDEVHTSVGAPSFSECSIYIPAKCTYGLSATPYRADGNGDIINYHLGEIFSDEDYEGTLDADVFVFLFNYDINTFKRKKYLYWGGKFQRSRYLNMLKKSDNFIKLSKTLLENLKDKRDLIYVAERIKLIEELFDWVKSESKAKFIKTAKTDTLDKKIVFATPGKIRDGVDAPWKDTLVMTSPISNIKQLAGRILRTHPNKKQPIIFDMVDIGCKQISSTFFNRFKFYEKRGWKINFKILKNNNFVLINEEDAFNILIGKNK